MKIGSIIKFIWKIVEKILMIALILVSIIILTQNFTENEKAFLGLRLFRVQTGSMIPKYEIGDVILVKEKNIDEINVGDDVTYWGKTGVMKGKLVTHQVIKVETIDEQKVFHTQGIANTTEDPVVYADQINGVVLGKSYILTLICSLMNNKYLFYFCGIVPLTLYVFCSFLKKNLRRV